MNIKKTLLNEFSIDIDQINLLKLYKINDADISSEELEEKFAACRKRWTQSANGANEQLAARDKARLAKAGDYEEILRNRTYLAALIAYYEGGDAEESASEFAKSFFTILKSVNKTITQKEYSFFMQYFREERKNEKAILECLKKDFKTVSLKPCSSFNDESRELKEEGKESVVIQVRFHRDTLSLLHKCELQYETLQKSDFLRSKYPDLNLSFYSFLKIEEMDETEFTMHIDSALQEVFTRRQNDVSKGAEYIPLTEFYNTWKDILKQSDVVNNFEAVKKLVCYPKFTPYLYLAENITKEYLEALLQLMRNDYRFGSFRDFLFLYFRPLAVGKHFSFSMDKKLEAELKKVAANPADYSNAEKRSAAAKQRRKMMPWPLRIMRILATWPIGLVQLIFESARFAVINLQKLAWMVGILLAVFSARAFTDNSIFTACWQLFANMKDSIEETIHSLAGTYYFNGFSAALAVVVELIQFALAFGLAPLLCALFLKALAKKLDSMIDFEGIHKTFLKIREIIEQKLINAYKRIGKSIYKRMLWPVAANLLGASVVAAVLILIITLCSSLASVTALVVCL